MAGEAVVIRGTFVVFSRIVPAVAPPVDRDRSASVSAYKMSLHANNGVYRTDVYRFWVL